MKIQPSTLAKASISIGLAILAFLFFWIKYPYHLRFHESLQLFMYTSAYAADVLSVPGGLADYISRFLVQLFYYPCLGAAIVALLLVGVQLTASRLLLNRDIAAYPLSLLPAVSLWWSLCDENGMLTAVVALLLAQAAAWAVVRIGKYPVRCAAVCIGIPLLYYLIGSLAVVMPVIALTHEYRRAERAVLKLIPTALSVLIAAASVAIAHSLSAYSWDNLIRGIQYCRFINLEPYMAWVSAAMSAICVPLSLLIPNTWRKAKKQHITTILLTAIIAVIGYAGVVKSVNYQKEEVFAYDYMANNRQWQQIIDRADSTTPDNPYTVACLNLALAMTGQMGDRMFGYFQNGTEGLLPPFMIDFTAPLPTSEALYNIGLVNVAQRYVFEAQEAIPDFQKSSRCYRRLAEISMIKGDYEVAEKYLKALDKTLFYRQWVDGLRALMADEEALNNHWEYGMLRHSPSTTDIFVGDNIQGALLCYLQDNPGNQLAFDYLIASCLLSGDLGQYYEYLSSCTFPANYIMPKAYQETLALMWVMNHPTWEGMPWNITPDIKKRMEGYLRDMKAKMPNEYMKSKYGDTYWYYYFTRATR